MSKPGRCPRHGRQDRIWKEHGWTICPRCVSDASIAAVASDLDAMIAELRRKAQDWPRKAKGR